MTAADFAGAVRFALTPATSPFPLTDGLYQTPTQTETVRGVIHQRSKLPADLSGLDDETAVLTMEKALFSTISEWTPNDRFKVPGEIAWQVRGATEHEAHLTFQLGRRMQREGELVADPQSILGNRLVMWLDAEDRPTVTSVASRVSAWTNKALVTGAVAGPVQATGVNQPLLNTLANSFQAIGFNPTEFLRGVAPVAAAPFRVFVVAIIEDSGSPRALVVMSQGILITEEFRLEGRGGAALTWNAVAAGVSSTASTSSLITQSLIFLGEGRELSASSREVELNGAGLGANAVSRSPSAINVMTIGARGDDSNPADAIVGEVVVVNEATGVVTAAERAQLETYFERWGVTIP